MFFIMGIMPGRKELNFHQTMICGCCGAYSSYSVYMTYTVLSLFFIPFLKWGRKYYVESRCCGSVWQLNAEVGKRIARGESVEIAPADLELIRDSGRTGASGRKQDRGPARICAACGFSTEEDYKFCPKCGKPL